MHKQPISFFSAHHINSLDDYERFYHTKRYLGNLNPVKESNFKLSPTDTNTIKNMMNALGYSNINKFRTIKNEWDSLRRPIPLKYFDYIGADRNVLEFTLELDNEEYEQAIELPRYPRYAIVRRMAAIYKNIKIPSGLREEDARSYLFDLMAKNRLRCCINYPELLSIFLEPNGTVNYVYYPPEIRFGKKYAVPVKDGTGIGMTYIGANK
jgi:hypothetical protein